MTAFRSNQLCLLAFAGLAVGCSAVDPKVGPSEQSCGESAPLTGPGGPAGYGASGGAGTGSTAGGYAGSSTGSSEAHLTCAADAGSACDNCETRWCCTSRLACYTDPVCTCADHALDGCLDDAGTSASAIAKCWSDFSAHGNVEKARVACERAWCQVPCGVP
jgi:hypothetical protein